MGFGGMGAEGPRCSMHTSFATLTVLGHCRVWHRCGALRAGPKHVAAGPRRIWRGPKHNIRCGRRFGPGCSCPLQDLALSVIWGLFWRMSVANWLQTSCGRPRMVRLLIVIIGIRDPVGAVHRGCHAIVRDFGPFQVNHPKASFGPFGASIQQAA